jgi:uncharacterized protein YndB with AHSA1/START domain
MSDRIEKEILLRAPTDRVWRALSDSSEFGYWFGVKFDAPFAPGAPMNGVMVTTQVDADVADLQRQYEGKPFKLTVVEMIPERLFSFRWHPHAVEPGMYDSTDPMTLVEFKLTKTTLGVLLTVTESGFDSIPLEHRAKAFQANEGGWSLMVKVIEEYLAKAA